MSRSVVVLAFASLAVLGAPLRASAGAAPSSSVSSSAPAPSSSVETPFPITRAPAVAPAEPMDDDALAKKRRIGWLALAAAAVVAMLVFGTQTQPS